MLKRGILQCFLFSLLSLGIAACSSDSLQHFENSREPATDRPSCGTSFSHFLNLVQNKHFAQLAQDPSHNFEITPNSLREAAIGVALEKSGKIPGPLVRDPSGSAEFFDAKGIAWDVKGFHSFAPNGSRMSTNAMIDKISHALESGEHLILDRRSLSEEDQDLLETFIEKSKLQSLIIWYPESAVPTR